MILVDSNIIIDFWKKPTENARRIFKDETIFICGVVKAELLHGAKDENNYRKIEKALNCFPFVSINNQFWDDLAKNLFNLKTNGISIPFQDAMIATISISNSLQLWSNDKHFIHIKDILPSLILYEKSSDY
jgi:predicted nucleic acid-binding protein